jgi:hypothetical protein
MLFRYDFGEKIDLSKFKKQVPYFISKSDVTSFDIYFKDYSIKFEIFYDHILYKIITDIYLLNKDIDGKIINHEIIFPLEDYKFMNFKEIKEFFLPTAYRSVKNFSDIKEMVDKIAAIIRIIHCVNNLKTFL